MSVWYWAGYNILDDDNLEISTNYTLILKIISIKRFSKWKSSLFLRLIFRGDTSRYKVCLFIWSTDTEYRIARSKTSFQMNTENNGAIAIATLQPKISQKTKTNRTTNPRFFPLFERVTVNC